MNEIRFALRQFGKNPGFTAVAVLILALGIGANTVVFSVINRVLLLPLPFQDPERLLWVRSQDPKNNVMDNSAAGPDFLTWRRDSQTLEKLSALHALELNLRGTGEPVAMKGAAVTSDFFATFGFRFVLGSAFGADPDGSTPKRVVVFSHRFWQRQFGGDTNLLGRTLTIDDSPHTVVGVLAPTISFLEELIEAYVLLPPARLADWESHDLQVFGRLKLGVTLPEARAELSAISHRVKEQWPKLGSSDATAFLLHERLVEVARPSFLLLHAMVAMVLVIACANVANLLLARAQGRRREMAIRVALGSSRARIIRESLTESLLLSVAGAALGILLARYCVELLPVLSPKFRGMSIPLFAEIGLDGHGLAFALLLAVAAGLGAGLVPAFEASKPDLNQTLQDAAWGTASPRRHRVLGLLVVGQTALSMVLLVSAVLLIRNFNRLSRTDPGFEPRNLLSMRVGLPGSRYPDTGTQRRFYTEILRQVEALGPVESAAVVSLVPMGRDNCGNSFRIVGEPPLPDGRYQIAEWRIVSAGYFETMRIPLRRGRLFNDRDQGRPSLIIVNEAFARKYLGAGDPLLRQIVTAGSGGPSQIVGVVGNEKFFGLGDPSPPILYLPIAQHCLPRMALVVRTRTDPHSVAKPVQRAIWEVDAAQAVSDINCLEELAADSISVQRFAAVLLTAFAALAVALSSVALYGVLAYAVSQRTHEIGVRMALGAQKQQILRMVYGRGWRLVAWGLVIGVAGALALSVVVQSLLHEMSARDPLTFLAATAILATTATAACHFPARQAMRVDPLVALRHE